MRLDALLAFALIFSGCASLTPLQRAARNGKTNAVKALLDAGSSVDDRAESPLTPLMLAASKSELESAKLLLDRGADIAATDSMYGRTPLGWAVLSDCTFCASRLETVRLLVERGADVNAKAILNGMRTPLTYAVEVDPNLEVATFLLDNGADPQAKRNDGKSALDLARLRGNPKIIALLEARSAQPRRPTRAELRSSQERDAEMHRAEAQGQAAEKVGHPRSAFGVYAKALQGAWVADEAASRVRDKLLRLAASLDPLPDVPEDARRHVVMAMTLAKDAREAADYKNAADEVRQAIGIAPWWPTAYFNLAKMEEGSGDYDAAISDLKLYLLGSPNARDARQVLNHIYALEAKKTESRR